MRFIEAMRSALRDPDSSSRQRDGERDRASDSTARIVATFFCPIATDAKVLPLRAG